MMTFYLAFLTAFVLAQAQAQQIDFCAAVSQLSGLINVNELSMLATQLCPNDQNSANSGTGSTCGTADGQLADLVMCALGADACKIQPSATNDLMKLTSAFLPQVLNQVPEYGELFSGNPIMCEIVQRSCCLSSTTSNVQTANLLASVISGQQVDLGKVITDTIGNLAASWGLPFNIGKK